MNPDALTLPRKPSRLSLRLRKHHLPLCAFTLVCIFSLYVTRPYNDVLSKISFCNCIPRVGFADSDAAHRSPESSPQASTASIERLAPRFRHLGRLARHHSCGRGPMRTSPWPAMALLHLRPNGTSLLPNPPRPLRTRELHRRREHLIAPGLVRHLERLLASSARLSTVEAASALELCSVFARGNPLRGISCH